MLFRSLCWVVVVGGGAFIDFVVGFVVDHNGVVGGYGCCDCWFLLVIADG